MKKLALKSIAVLAIKCLAAGASFYLITLITRTLGAEDSGAYFTIFSLVTIIALLARQGYDQTCLKIVPRNIKNEAILYQQVRYLIKNTATASIAASTILILATYPKENNALHIFGLEQYRSTLYYITPSIFFLSLTMLCANLLKALERPYIASTIESLAIPVTTIVILKLGHDHFSTLELSLSYTASSTVVFLVAAAYIAKSTPYKPSKVSHIDIHEIKKTSYALLAVTFLQLLTKEAPVLIAANRLTHFDVSMLAVSTRISLLLTLLLIATTTILAPLLSKLYFENKKEEIYKIITVASIALTLSGVTIFTITIFIAKPALALLFGDDFVYAYQPLLFLMAGQLVNIATGPVQTLLIMSGNEIFVRNSTIIYSLTTIVLVWLLAPIGVTAISAAICSATSIYNIWLIFKSYELCGVAPFAFKK